MNELSSLQQQIDEALRLLQEAKLFELNEKNNESKDLSFEAFNGEPDSLLEKCERICAEYESQKPTIRIIHHLACSGGTLISKCLSVMPNVYLLSEVHPHSKLHVNKERPTYMPSDLASLSRYARIPNIEKLNENLFCKGILTICNHVRSLGGCLVLRDHSHTDFHTGSSPMQLPGVKQVLAEKFQIKSVLTFRDPIDSFLSLKENKWIQFSPGTFEEYCSRILLMLNTYKAIPLFHYEKFVENTPEILKEICNELSIEYNDAWSLLFDMAQVTGDSGRSGNQISKRPRRNLDDKFLAEISSSESYEIIRHKFNYRSEIV